MQEVFGFVKKNLSGAVRSAAEERGRSRRKGCGERGGSPFPCPVLPSPRRASARRLSATFFAHRVAPHFEAMRVVHQAVEDAIGGRGIADLLMPARDRQL